MIAVLVVFLILLPFIFTGLLVFAVAILAILAIAGLIFYIRIRLALRRFRKAVAFAQKAAAGFQAGRQASDRPKGPTEPTRDRGPDASGNVIDAEFKVKDEP
jgi:hypothetical protein